MAIVEPDLLEITTRGDYGHIITWGPLGAGDEGDPISMIGSTRRTIQMIGGFPAGSTVTIEGSNDKVNWSPITDVHGNKLIFKSAGLSTVQDLTLWIRPRATAGAPAATVKMLIRKTEAR